MRFHLARGAGGGGLRRAHGGPSITSHCHVPPRASAHHLFAWRCQVSHDEKPANEDEEEEFEKENGGHMRKRERRVRTTAHFSRAANAKRAYRSRKQTGKTYALGDKTTKEDIEKLLAKNPNPIPEVVEQTFAASMPSSFAYCATSYRGLTMYKPFGQDVEYSPHV